MFTVFFITDHEAVCVFKSEKDVEALNFALSLHQASNVPHRISVEDSEGTYGVVDDRILLLISK